MNKCITFITTIASNCFDRSPLTFVIVRNGNALNLNEIRSLEVKLLEKKKELILTHLIKVNILSTNDSYKALEQCSLFLEEIRWLHFPNKLIISCNTAHSHYKASLGEKAKEAKKVGRT